MVAAVGAAGLLAADILARTVRSPAEVPVGTIVGVVGGVTLSNIRRDPAQADVAPQIEGAGRAPQEWMWPGDVIECGVDGIGVLRNPVIDTSSKE